MKKNEIKEHLEKGYLQVHVMFEIIGNPEAYVDKAIKSVIAKIKEDSKITFLEEDFGAPEKTSDGLFGVYCETEMLIPDLYTLSWMAFNFSPASIEIIEPSKLTFSDKELSDLFNDLLGHIHEQNTRQVEMKSVNQALQINLNAMMRNAVLVGLGTSEKTSAEVGKLIGVKEKDLIPILEAMIKENRIEKNKSKYKRTK